MNVTYKGIVLLLVQTWDKEGYPSSEWHWVQDGKAHTAPSLASAKGMVDYILSEQVAA